MNKKKQLERLQKIQSELSPEQREVLKTRKLSGRYSTLKWMKIMKKLALFDEFGDLLYATIKKKRNWAIAFMIFFFIVALLFNENFSGVPMVAFFVLSLVSLVLLIVWSRSMKKLRSNDLDNGFRNLVVPLVGIFNEEIKSGTKLLLEVDAGDPMRKENYTDTQKKQSFHGRTFVNYYSEWLKGNLILVDGAQLYFSSVKKCQKIKITKRSRSGKTKYKTKIKLREINQFKLVLPKSNYQLQPDQYPHIRKQETETEIVLKAKITRKSALIDNTSLEVFLNTIHAMYNTVKPLAS